MKRNVWIMYAIAFLQGMIFYAPIATLYRQAHGITIFEITLLESISFAVCIALEVPWGILSEKIGYRRTMIFCCILYFLSKIVFWQADGFSFFFIERVLLSVVVAGISGVDASILYLSCDKKNSQHAFGMYRGLEMGGLFLAAILFSIFIQERYDQAALWSVYSYGLAMLLSFFLVEVKEETSRQDERNAIWKDIRSLFQKKQLFLLLLAIALFSQTHQTVTVFLNQMQYQAVHLSDAGIGAVYIVSAFVGIYSVSSAWFIRKLGYSRSIYLVCGTAALACLLLSMTSSIAGSVGSILWIRILYSIFEPIQMELQNREIQTANRAAMLSAFAMFMDGVAIFTNLFFGWFSQIGIAYAFLLGACFCAGSGLLFFRYFIGKKK